MVDIDVESVKREIANTTTFSSLGRDVLATIDQLQSDLTAARAPLSELLAVIHRDGGQRMDAIGVDAACIEAMHTSSERIAKIAAMQAAIVETCRRADLRFSPALIAEPLRPFLPAPVDPLVEALREVHAKGYYETEEAFAHDLRQALAARGLDVTAKGDA